MAMAKKKDFKPDKTWGGWSSRLFLTQKQQRSLLKWSLYGLMLLVLSLVQDVLLCRFRILGATTELVPVGIFLICVLEGLETGSVFALTASALYLFSGSSAGAYAMVLITALAIGMTLLRQAYLQEGFSTAMLCTAGAMLLYELFVFVVGLILGLTPFARILGFLITATLSVLAAPLLYPIALSIGRIGGDTWRE